MNENVKVFLNELATNKELTAKLATVKDPEEGIKMIKEAMPNAFTNFTVEELQAEMKKISEAQKGANRELSDDDVTDVAGGYDTDRLKASIAAIF